MDDLDAATLAAYRQALEDAASVLDDVGMVGARESVLGATGALFAAIERRQAREREMIEIVRDVAEAEPYYSEQPEGWYCTLCDGWAPFDTKRMVSGQARDFKHTDVCPVTRARALLEGGA